MVTKAYLKPTYIPTYLPTYVTVVTVVTIVTEVTFISNNGVSYMFYNVRDILTPSDYVFQAEVYRS